MAKKKQPTNLSIQPEILRWADEIMAQRHYNSLSVLVEELIRERYDQLAAKGLLEPPKSSSSTSGLRYPEHSPQLNEVHESPEKPKKKKAA